MKNFLKRNHFISVLFSKFNEGNERSVNAKKNIFFLVLIKLLSILISLLLVPVTIGYVSSGSYGIWLTVSSIVVWFGFFDIGLSNGMRNRFAEATARGDEKAAKTYVSTTYISLAVIFFVLWIIFIFLNRFLNWSSILNISENISLEVQLLVFIVFSYFCMQFVLKTVNMVLIANQQPAISSLIDLIGQVFSLLIIWVLTKTTEGSLINLGLGLTIAPLIVLLGANLLLFNRGYKKYAPAFRDFKFEYLNNIFGLSAKFFIIQVAALVQYQTANFIIARNFDMESVTDYNITYKYFNILLMGFTIILSPFWSASTDAYARGDFSWIKNTIKRYRQVLLLFICFGTIMLSVASFAYDIWIGKGVTSISFVMSFWCFIYVATTMYGSIYVHLLNGIGAVKIQFYSSLITPILFILLCWIFIENLHMGVYCIFIASIISNLNGIALAPLQYRKVFVEKKGGLWKA